MSRVKRGTTTKAKHKSVLAKTKGFRHGRKNLIKLARQADVKAGQYAYRDRRVKKRTMRALWIIKLNAAVRAEGLTYSEFIKRLTEKNITINRKVLSDLAVKEPTAFAAVVAKVK